MSCGDVVLNYNDILLRQTDVDLLAGHHWLNDQIISFKFEVLQSSVVDCHATIKIYPASITQLLKLEVITDPTVAQAFLGEPAADKIDYAIWAVNNALPDELPKHFNEIPLGSHWSLLVFSRPDNHFIHIDSMSRANSQEANLLFNNLSPLFSSNSRYCDLPTNRQINSYDCGLHALANAEKVVNFIKRSVEDGFTMPSLIDSGMNTANHHEAADMRKALRTLISSLQARDNVAEAGAMLSKVKCGD